jgi:hypothetical protein
LEKALVEQLEAINPPEGLTVAEVVQEEPEAVTQVVALVELEVLMVEVPQVPMVVLA